MYGQSGTELELRFRGLLAVHEATSFCLSITHAFSQGQLFVFFSELGLEQPWFKNKKIKILVILCQVIENVDKP